VYSRQIKQFMQMNIIHISKLEFLYAFREAFFAGAGLIPYNLKKVISKLNIRIRTLTPLTLSLTTALP